MTDGDVEPPRTIVVDTSVLFISAQPWDVPQLSPIPRATYVIPATVLFELDHLMAKPETRDRARSARNALRPLVDRGAMQGAISCGETASVRVASGNEEIPHPSLDLNIADDRILALAIKLKDDGENVVLATTEFMLYAKAATMGVTGMLIEPPEPTITPTRVSKRQRDLFWSSWQKVDDARSPFEVLQRGYQFLRQGLVQRLLAEAAQIGQPELPLIAYKKFQQLEPFGGANVDLPIIGIAFGLGLAPQVNSSVEMVIEYKDSYSVPQTRSESAAERAFRLQRQQAALDDYKTRVVETVRANAQIVRDYVIAELGDELG